jgi:hypothetical protein
MVVALETCEERVIGMPLKSAVDIALEKTKPRSRAARMTAAQKATLADIERARQAKIAELKITLEPRIAAAGAAGDQETADKLRAELVESIAKAERDAERKRKAARKG